MTPMKNDVSIPSQDETLHFCAQRFTFYYPDVFLHFSYLPIQQRKVFTLPLKSEHRLFRCQFLRLTYDILQKHDSHLPTATVHMNYQFCLIDRAL